MKINLQQFAQLTGAFLIGVVIFGTSVSRLHSQETATETEPQETEQQAEKQETEEPAVQEREETDGDLPDALTILNRYVEVTGGVENYKNIESMKAVGSMNIPAQGISGTMTTIAVHPNKIHVEVEFEGIGTEVSTFNGENGWAMSVMTGNRLLTAEEIEEQQLQASMQRIYDPLSVYSEICCTGTETVDDKECYVIELTRDSGVASQEYYDIESGLQVMSKATSKTAMGDISTVSTVSDFNEVGGVLIPFKVEVEVNGSIGIEVQIEDIELNIEDAESAFEIPEVIEKLIAKEKARAEQDEADQATEETDREEVAPATGDGG